MKIIALSGTYRKGKTIDTLIDKAVEGIKEVDPSIEVEKIQLIDKDIKYCTNCATCKTVDPAKPVSDCVIQDDMQKICPKMVEADGYILGVPINCGTVTAVWKTFYERSAWVLAKPGTKPIKGCPNPRTDKKRAALFILSAGLVPPVLRCFCDDASRLLKDFCECCLNAKVVGNMYAGALEKRGMSYYFDQARKEGKKLARALL